MSEKTTDKRPPIEQPPICLIMRVLTENTDSFNNITDSFLNTDILHKCFNSLLVYIRL